MSYKIFSSFITIPGIFVSIIIILIIMYYFKNKSLNKHLIILALLIYFLSINLSNLLFVKPLETFHINNINYTGLVNPIIIVLGGGITEHNYNNNLGDLSDSSIHRTINGYFLHKKTNIPILVTGGSAHNVNGISEAILMKNFLIDLGMKKEAIFIEQLSKNTLENALYSFNLILNNNFSSVILLTSATHMKRAYFIFSDVFIKREIEIIPFSVNYTVTDKNILWNDFLPNISALNKNAKAIHEHIGIIYYYLFQKRNIIKYLNN